MLGDAACDCLADISISPWREYEAVLGHRNWHNVKSLHLVRIIDVETCNDLSSNLYIGTLVSGRFRSLEVPVF